MPQQLMYVRVVCVCTYYQFEEHWPPPPTWAPHCSLSTLGMALPYGPRIHPSSQIANGPTPTPSCIGCSAYHWLHTRALLSVVNSYNFMLLEPSGGIVIKALDSHVA